MLGKTPIAILQLLHQKTQTIAAALGVTFITILLFMQIGFRSGFLSTLVDLPAALDGDLFLLNASYVTVLRPPTTSLNRLHSAQAFEEVESVVPVYLSAATMKDPSGHPRFLRKIQVIGFPLVDPAVIDDGNNGQEVAKLSQSKSFLLDERSRKEFRPVIEEIREGEERSVEIRTSGGQKSVVLRGLFPLGANTSTNSHMLTSDNTFMDIFRRQRENINIGLINLHPGADPFAVAEALNDYLPEDVVVIEKQALLEKEWNHYEFNSPIGLIFRFGLGGAVVVGVVILYQILYQMLTKYLRDYATMKAIGFSVGMLRKIVLKEALILATLGFIPGFFGSLFVYDYLSQATSLKFEMTAPVSIGVLVSICFICLASALFAIRKLNDADPADLFS